MRKTLLLTLVLLSTCGYAQVSNSNVLFYVPVSSTNGKTWSTTNPEIYLKIFRFISGELYEIGDPGSQTLKQVCDKLRQDDNYFDHIIGDNMHQGHDQNGIRSNCYYEKELSNSKWDVYAVKWSECPNTWPAHVVYTAFKVGKKEILLIWTEPDFGKSGRTTYRLITKEELKKLRFTSARDFLQ